MKAVPPSVAALVVHYDSPDTLKRTLENLRSHFDRNHILVVDNSSSLTDKSFHQLATIIDDGRNRGYAGGVNRGFDVLQNLLPDVREVLVCTHETLFRSDAIDLLLATAGTFPEGHIVGPRLVTTVSGDLQSIWSNGGHLRMPFYYPTHDTALTAQGVRNVKWVDGAAFVMDVHTWRQLGGVPEEFFMYMEDVAMGVLARKAGFPVVVNLDAVVEQTANGPSRKLAIRNRTILALRYMSPLQRNVVRAEIWVRAIIMKMHPSAAVRGKSMESQLAVQEAREIVAGLPATRLSGTS